MSAECGLEDAEISEDEDDLETSWVECDICKEWFHLACLGMTNARKLLHARVIDFVGLNNMIYIIFSFWCRYILYK